MQIHSHYSLKTHNTFGLAARAAEWVQIDTAAEVAEALQLPDMPLLVLGGGSNVLFLEDFEGRILWNNIRKRVLLESEGTDRLVGAGGGENWHDFVLWTLEQGWGGLENLSLIPGKVGAAPIQNIGAYGVELSDTFFRLQAANLKTGELRWFDREACAFGYRDSIFKRKEKGNWLITEVQFTLSTAPKTHLEYGAIRHTLSEMGVQNPGPKEVSRAVVHIRSNKLPDPAELGNSGSFFKNPQITQAHFRELQRTYPEMVHYPLPGGAVKVPAGWLIEQCGWKGKRVGNVGCHARQALVLINYGGATGEELWEHALRVRESVGDTFGIWLEPEVNLIGSSGLISMEERLAQS